MDFCFSLAQAAKNHIFINVFVGGGVLERRGSTRLPEEQYSLLSSFQSMFF